MDYSCLRGGCRRLRSNAGARFDQVEDVTDAERDRAWKRIKSAAKRFDVEVEADDWRELFKGGKAKKR